LNYVKESNSRSCPKYWPLSSYMINTKAALDADISKGEKCLQDNTAT